LAGVDDVNVLPTELASMWKGNEPPVRQSAVLGNIFALLRRQYAVILLGGLVGIALSIAFLATARPEYEATASLLMDTSQVYASNNPFSATPLVTDEVMSSQIELVRSQRVASLVVDELALYEDVMFEAPESVIAVARNMGLSALAHMGIVLEEPDSLSSSDDKPPTSPEDAFNGAVDQLRAMISVDRVPLTYVVDVKFQSPYPDLAAAIVNSVANSFLRHQVAASVNESLKINEWLTTQILEAGQKSEEADLAVERYRIENNLITTGGTPVGETQLADINNRLAEARAVLSQSEAVHQQALSVLEGRDPEAMSAALTGVDSARNLLGRYDGAREHLTTMQQRLAPGHQQIEAARADVAQIVDQLDEELGRLVANPERDVQLARGHVAELEQRQREIVDENADANVRTIALRELERTATIYRDLHQNLLLRQQEVLQNGSVPSIKAQIINDAFVPDTPVHPDRTFTLIVLTLAGMVGGATIGILRELNDRSFRNGEQLTRATTLPFAGYFPNFNKSAPYSPRADSEDHLSYAQMHPQSLAANTLRNMRVAVEMDRTNDKGGQTIAITSSLQGEGKTTLAINFARHLASSGFKVIMVDLDMWNRALSRSLKLSGAPALQDVIEKNSPLEKVIVRDASSPAYMARAASRRMNVEKFFGSAELMAQIETLKSNFDYVILDFPPLAIISDTSLLIRYSDMVVFAVHWGKTSRGLVERVLAGALNAGTNIVCGVLTMANPAKIKRFEEPDWEPRQYQYASYSEEKSAAH
jgi:succinoglycan biosynthesis transport protein ExoP